MHHSIFYRDPKISFRMLRGVHISESRINTQFRARYAPHIGEPALHSAELSLPILRFSPGTQLQCQLSHWYKIFCIIVSIYEQLTPFS